MMPELALIDEEREVQRYHGVYSAQVVNLADPLMLGRVQVRVSAFDPLDVLPWARVVTPMAGLLHGTYFVPSLGDEVVVAFENGDRQVPYVLGSVHNVMRLPPMPSPLGQIRAIRSPLGNQLVFSEVGPLVALQSGPTPPAALPAPPSPTAAYSSLALSPTGVTTASPGAITLLAGGGIALQCGGNSITVNPAGVFINGQQVTVAASGSTSVTAPSVRINS